MMDVLWEMQEFETCPDLATRGQFLQARLDAYNVVGLRAVPADHPCRRTLEILTQHFVAEARARDHSITIDQPDFWPAWKQFCEQSQGGAQAAEESVNYAALLPSRSRIDVRCLDNEAPGGHQDVSRPFNSSLVAPRSRGQQTDQDVNLAATEPLIARRGRSYPFDADVTREAFPVPRRDDAPIASEVVPALPYGRPSGESVSNKWTLSIAAEAFLTYRETEQGDGRSREDTGIVLQFAIDLLGDRPLSRYELEDFNCLEAALVDIPARSGIPKAHATTLHARYLFAQTHGWDGLKRLSRTRLGDVYHVGLNSFFKWCKKKSGHPRDLYEFDLVSDKNVEAQDRDAWTDAELIKLFSLPLFCGAQSRERIWTAGDYLVQNGLYWAYIITFFLGMRASEIGKLLVTDLVCIESRWFFDLTKRACDSERRFKSKAAQRKIPLPELLLDLGIVERRDALAERGEKRLFPDLPPYTHAKSKRIMYGHHFSKSWQYIKQRFNFAREGLTLHGGRHTRAGWYDRAGIPQRIRNRLLGHAPQSVADRYGPIHITPEEASFVLSKDNPIEAQIATILLDAKLAADAGRLTTLETC